MLFEILLSSCITFLIWLLIKASNKPENFPPGPRRIPWLGSIPFLSSKPAKEGFNLFFAIRNLADKYGPVAGFYVAGTPAVVVSDHGLLKELYKVNPNNLSLKVRL